jgi:hypothetical protein
VTARWLDPTNATYTTIGSAFPNSGSRAFSVPGINSTGQTDWVLVLNTGTPPAAPTGLRIVP